MAPKKKSPKHNKKASKPKKPAKKMAAAKAKAAKKAPPKKAAPKKSPVAKSGKGRTRARGSESFESKIPALRRGKPPAEPETADLNSANEEGAEELLEDGTVFEVEIVEGVEDVADEDLGDLKKNEIPEDDSPEEY